MPDQKYIWDIVDKIAPLVNSPDCKTQDTCNDVQPSDDISSDGTLIFVTHSNIIILAAGGGDSGTLTSNAEKER